MNELDKLREMLNEAGIPYESVQREFSPEVISIFPEYYNGARKYSHNQIVYGRNDNSWKIDGICQMGSYGVEQGLIETYGELGVDAEGDPLVLRAEDVFQIIKEDWENGNNSDN